MRSRGYYGGIPPLSNHQNVNAWSSLDATEALSGTRFCSQMRQYQSFLAVCLIKTKNFDAEKNLNLLEDLWCFIFPPGNSD